MEKFSIGIIGGADGPTKIFLTGSTSYVFLWIIIAVVIAGAVLFVVRRKKKK